MKKKENEEVIPVELELTDRQIMDSRGNWIPKKVIQIPGVNGYITVCGVIGGCGLAQMHGTTAIASSTTLTKEELVKAFSVIRTQTGAVIGTLGDTFYFCEKRLLELGFERIAEYINFQHGPKSTQRLYILKI